MGRFDGKVAIVTGGALGIGGATARRLAADGASVLIVDVEGEAGAFNEKRIRDAGGDAFSMTGDVAREEVAKEMVEKAVSEWGRLDFLVQNAYGGGRDRGGSAVEISADAWDSGMALLARAHFLGAKYAVPEMAKNRPTPAPEGSGWHGERAAAGTRGSIVNLSSVHGLLMAAGSLIYEAGKSAVVGMTRQMAIDFGPLGVRVNAIAPGHIVTERGRATWDEQGNPDGYRLFELQYPVRRNGVPDDIANAIAFLCSDEASFITGVVLPVDGGLSIQLQENIVMEVKDYIVGHPDLRTHFDSGRGVKRE